LSLVLFLVISLLFNSCAQAQVPDDFYRGLLSIEAGNKPAAAKHFEKALDSSNMYIRQAAAGELSALMFEGAELSAKTLDKVRKEASGSWAAVFDAAGKSIDREKALAFLLNFEHGAASNEARLFLLRECEKHTLFNETELAAIEGHFASSRSRYNEALAFFRGAFSPPFLEEGKWPAQIPPLFIKFPVLINDLGRAFQYTASGKEGLDLFLQWEKALTVEPLNAPALPAPVDTPAALEEARFRLQFYAARNARRIGRHDQAISLFEQARPLAADSEQADACIWYILDSSLNGNADVFLRRLEETVPHWQNSSNFDDVLEKFLQMLVSKREKERLIRAYLLIREKGAAFSKASYAWTIARFIQEGYFSAQETSLAALAANVDAAQLDAAHLDAAVYMRIAYNAGDTSFYYHSLSAVSLGEAFIKLQDEAAKNGAARGGKATPAGRLTPAVQFLNGFFENGAGHLSLGFIRPLEKELSADELRAVAQALAKAGMYAQSMRIVSIYIKRDGYVPGRPDLELMYPRPFKELVEKYAAQCGIAPALLYGLIRTESAFQSDIISRAGAVGLTQLIPSTAVDMAARIRRTGGPDYTSPSGIVLADPAQNIHIGSFYLNYLMGRFDDPLLSVLAYNGGMNRVRRWRAASSMPADLFMETITISETRDYGRKVFGAAAVYEELYYRR